MGRQEDAHRVFRNAVAGAHSHGQVEAAASAWLVRINDVNRRITATQTRLRHAQEAAEALLTELTRLSDTADTSATMAEAAMKACRAARAALGGSGEAGVAEAPISNPADLAERAWIPSGGPGVVQPSPTDATAAMMIGAATGAGPAGAPRLPPATTGQRRWAPMLPRRPSPRQPRTSLDRRR